jgi:hypothetical protein
VHFRELYNQVVAQNLGKPVGFDFLQGAVIAGLPWLEEVCIWRLSHNPPTRQAKYMLFDDRSSAYNGEYLVADISFCASLEEEPDELLFALSKELMHVFDPRNTWIDTREKFVAFLKDLQNTPLDVGNGALNMEHRAKWMALLVLCPKPFRDQLVADLNKGALRSELAERHGLPEWFIETALDDYYDEALRILTE